MNRPMPKLLVAMTLALGGLAAPAIAGETTAISYHQVGICKGYDTAAGPVTTRSDEAFAIFKIEAVDNTKPSGSFDFDPTHLYVDQSTPEQKAKTAVWDKNRRFVYSDPRFARNMGASSAMETTIPEGTKLEINGIAVVPLGINNPSGGGYVGAELVQMFFGAGVAVTLVFRTTLLPKTEPEIGQALQRYFIGEGERRRGRFLSRHPRD